NRRIDTVSHDALKSVAKIRAEENLLRVCFAYRRHRIGEDNTDLHEIQHSVKLERTHGVELGWIEARSRHSVSGENTLISEIMDCEDSSCPRQVRVMTVVPLQIRGDE